MKKVRFALWLAGLIQTWDCFDRAARGPNSTDFRDSGRFGAGTATFCFLIKMSIEVFCPRQFTSVFSF